MAFFGNLQVHSRGSERREELLNSNNVFRVSFSQTLSKQYQDILGSDMPLQSWIFCNI